MQSINERRMIIGISTIYSNKSFACLPINEEISQPLQHTLQRSHYALTHPLIDRKKERERRTHAVAQADKQFPWPSPCGFRFFGGPLSVFRSGQSYVDVMFEYTLIMAICSAFAPANYAHEMAYYWPTQRHIRIHIERDGQTDREIYKERQSYSWTHAQAFRQASHGQISTPNGPQRPLSFGPKRSINKNNNYSKQSHFGKQQKFGRVYSANSGRRSICRCHPLQPQSGMMDVILMSPTADPQSARVGFAPLPSSPSPIHCINCWRHHSVLANS